MENRVKPLLIYRRRTWRDAEEEWDDMVDGTSGHSIAS